MESTALPRDIRPFSILDPIHGLIRFTDLERQVVDHPLFRRLRKVKQNGLLYLVFPSATHHRFAHSCGAMHVADLMLEQIWLNSVVSAKKGAVEPFTVSRSDVAIDFSSVPLELLRWVVRVTRWAALVHDLGHGPLSHTFDSFAIYREDLRALLEAGVVPSLSNAVDALIRWDQKGIPGSTDYDRVPHEVMSCVFFGRIWEAVISHSPESVDAAPHDERAPLAVAAAILGDPRIAAGTHSEEELRWLPFIHDLIASAPADADRMDYLERDSRTIGVSYGLFDRNRVMKSLLCFRSSAQNDGATYRLGVKKSGVPAMENLVQARYELYAQVYYHKTNYAITLMLGDIARAAHRDKVQLFPIDKADPIESFSRIADRYVDLSDDQFMRVLRGVDSGYPSMPSTATRIAREVECRELWKRIYETDERGSLAICDHLQSLNFVPSDDLLRRVSQPKATKDLDKGATLLARGEDGYYTPQRGHTWYGSSVVIRALAKAEANIGRVYARGGALKPETRKRLVREARRLGRQYEIGRESRRKADREAHARLQADLDKQQESTTHSTK